MSNHGSQSRINFLRVIIEQYYSNEDRDINENFSEEEDNDNNNFSGHVNFDASESSYEDKNFNVHSADINQKFS